MIRARIFNVKYSPNLGDGLLAESLENALVECGCDSRATYSVDLAARSSYGGQSSSGRASLLKMANALPGVVRQMLARMVLARKRAKVWLPHYRTSLEDCDVIVIGGGNLLTDLDLNFPTKLSALINEATDRGLPIAIYGVGVSAHWSTAGLKMMRAALAPANVVYASVRDEASKQNFDRLFGAYAGRTAEIVCDPGILVSRYVGQPQAPAQEPKSVGLGIISAIALRYHSSTKVSDRRLLAWYADIYRSIQAQGIPVHLFTNGSP
ncbi:MAG TPA: polysaccharide pyruvyl transferase family protein, partial [Pararhizobium sp.]|nr:polysaccharide pyruvyl transferase family protein [Pararhizobium sp.]